MARSHSGDYLLRNPELQVDWAGFRTTSRILGRCGWNMAVGAQDGFSGKTEVMFHNPEIGVTLYGHSEGDWGFSQMNPFLGDFDRTYILLTGLIAKQNDLHIRRFSPPRLESMKWTETEPFLTQVRDCFFHEMPLFMELAKPAAQELIIDPADVGRILEMVHKAQAPEQAEIRARNRRREKENPMTLHAHILSLAA